MKRILIICGAVLLMAMNAKAQKFALVDMEYIMKNIPVSYAVLKVLENVLRNVQKGSLYRLPFCASLHRYCRFICRKNSSTANSMLKSIYPNIHHR